MQITEILTRLQGVKKDSDGYQAKCPAHDDKKSSFHCAEKDGKILVHCYAGCSFDQICESLQIKKSDFFLTPMKKNLEEFTIKELAWHKNIPLDFLQKIGAYQENGHVKISYKDKDGQETCRQRIRKACTAKEGSKWVVDERPIMPYGLWLEMNQNSDYVLMVEGESDSWTAWYNDFPALGIPGADMTKTIQYEHIKKYNKIYIVQEPDHGGEIFVKGIKERLDNIGWNGQAIVVQIGSEAKDTNELWKQNPDKKKFRERYEALLKRAENGNTEPFPIEIFPPTIQAWLKNISNNLSCPIDYTACGLLAVISVLCGKTSIYIPEKDWREKAILYMSIIAQPGSGKSPALQKMLAILYQIEEDFQQENELAESHYEEELANYELDLNRWKSQQKSNHGGNRPEKPEKPIRKTIFTTDITSEALAEIASNNNAILVFKDEISGWVASMDQYRNGRGEDREFYLSLWNGNFAKVDRKRQKPIIVTDPHVSVLGGVVPDKLPLLNQETHDGFFDRLLCSYPEHMKRIWTIENINNKIRNEAMAILKNVFLNNMQPKTITLTNNALLNFSLLYESCNENGDGFKSKLPGYTLRLALIISAIWSKDDCDETVMNYAMSLAKYFEEHHAKAVGNSRESKEQKEQNAIIAWMQRKNMKKAKVRDLLTARLAGCGTAKMAKIQMQELVDSERATWVVEQKEIEIC